MSEGKISAAIVRLSDLFESGRLQASLAPAEFIHQVADEIVKLRQQLATERKRAERAEEDALQFERRFERAEAALAEIPVAALWRCVRDSEAPGMMIEMASVWLRDLPKVSP